MSYQLLSNVLPEMPKRLPGYIKLVTSKVPDHMKPAAANGLFPPTAANMHGVTFRWIDNVVHEPTFMEGVVSPSGVGKGYLDEMCEALIRFLREHDCETRRKLEEYARICKSKGLNKDKPERPTDVAILVPEPDMTNPALVQLLKDAEAEGDLALYTLIPEVDLLDQCAGGHKKVTRVIRLNFDSKRYGAQRATIDGISGNPFLRWRFNFSCVIERAQSFFKVGLTDGTLGRIGLSYIPKPPRRKGMPRQGNYDEAYYKALDEYLVRLRSATGEIKVPKIDTLMNRLRKELEEISDLADDDIFESFCHRSLVIAWLKGCVLYIAEGYRWTQEIANFVEWSLYYDLWSKIAIFAPQMKASSSKATVADVRKFGPANMLDMLPDAFQQAQLEDLRIKLDKPAFCTNQLGNWRDRGYVTYDEERKLYTKTPEYLSRHRGGKN